MIINLNHKKTQCKPIDLQGLCVQLSKNILCQGLRFKCLDFYNYKDSVFSFLKRFCVKVQRLSVQIFIRVPYLVIQLEYFVQMTQCLHSQKMLCISFYKGFFVKDLVFISLEGFGVQLLESLFFKSLVVSGFSLQLCRRVHCLAFRMVLCQ